MKAPSAILDPLHSIKVDDFVAGLAWSPDAGRIAVAGGEGKVFLLNNEAAKLQVNEVGEHLMGATAVVWQTDGAAFSSIGQDGRLALFDGRDGAEKASLRLSRQPGAALEWCADTKQWACAAGKSLFLCSADLSASELCHEAATSLTALAYDQAGRGLAASRNGGVDVHRWAAEHQVRHYPWASPCLTAAFSPNGKIIASGTQDGSVHFWYLATGKDSQMRGYPDKVDVTVWRHDSRYLATAAGEQLVIWDFGGKGPEGSRPLQLRSHTERIVACAFQPGGSYLASVGRDWRLSLWQPGKVDIDLDAHMTHAEPTSLAWSPDGRFIAVGTRSGDITLYGLRLVG